MAKTSEANFQLRIQKLLMLVMWIGRGDGWKEGIEQLALVKFRAVMACWLISKNQFLFLDFASGKILMFHFLMGLTLEFGLVWMCHSIT